MTAPTLLQTIRSGLASVLTLAPTSSVAVVDVSGVTVSAMLDAANDAAEWAQTGIDGKLESAFLASAATGSFTRGDLITVGGKKCSVETAVKDALGSMWRVVFTERQ